MRIDGTSSIEPNGLPTSRSARAKSKVPDKAVSTDALPDDPQIIYLYRKYATGAVKPEQVDQEAIAQARQDLAAGRLDTPEAIRRAAEAIIPGDS